MLSRQRIFWFISIAILFLAGLVAYRYYKYPFIKNQISNIVASKTDSLYRIHYESIELNELAGSLYVSNLSVTGDTVLQNKYVKTGDSMAASMLLKAFVPRIEVVGFKTAKALLGKELSCNKIILLKPRITVSIYPGYGKNKEIATEGQTLYRRILGQFKEIEADTLSIVGAEIVVQNAFSGEIKLLTFNTSLVLSGVLIDSLHYYDTSRTLFSKHMAFQTDKVVVGDKPALAEATLVTFDTKQKVLGIAAIQHNGLQKHQSFSSAAKNIIISGLQVKGAFNALQVSIDKASVQRADISIRKEKNTGNNKRAKAGLILTGWLKSFSINSFAAGDVALDYAQGNGALQKLVLEKSAVDITRLRLDTTAVMDASLIDKAGNLVITNKLVSVSSKDRMYKYNLSGFRLDTRSRSIRFSEIAVLPQLSEKAFANKAVVQKDRYDTRLKNLEIGGIDLKKLFDGQVSIDRITAANSSVSIYRDISKKSDRVLKVGQFPHQIVSKIKLPVTIKSISLQNTRIAYKEKNPLSDTSGTVMFDKANITITNVTNDVNTQNKVTGLKAKLYFLGSIPIDVSIKFYLDQISKGGFQVSANSNKVYEGSVLNTLTVPMALLRIDAGSIDGLSFDLNGDNYTARGALSVKYHDLKVSVMARDKKKGNFDKKGAKSLLANVLVKNSNPKNGKLRTANIVYERNQYKSFFNMIWKFVFTGLKDVMGPK